MNKLELKIASEQDCLESYGSAPYVICGEGLDGASLCAGDSGGPLQWVCL